MTSVRDMRGGGVEKGLAGNRTERDIPISWVAIGSLVLVLVIAFLPNLPTGGFPASLATTPLPPSIVLSAFTYDTRRLA